MADNSQQGQFSPEQLQILDWYAKGLLGPERQLSGAGYAQGIEGILNAIVGHSHLQRNNDIRLRQQRAIGESNVPNRRRTPINRPPEPIEAPMSPMPPTNRAPIINTPPVPRPRSAIPPTAPSATAGVGAPASAPPGAIETGAASPTAPQSGLSYAQGEDVVRNAMGARGQRGFNIQNDLNEFSQLVQGRSDPTPNAIDKFFVEKYGPKFTAAIYNNPQMPIQAIFQQFYDRLGTPDEAFTNSIPAQFRNRDPSSIPAGEWFSYYANQLTNGNLGSFGGSNTPSAQSSTQFDAPMQLGGQDLAQLQNADEVAPFLTETTPTEAQPLNRGQQVSQQGGTGGVSGSEPGPQQFQQQQDIPFNLPRSLPASERVQVLESQLAGGNQVYAMMSQQERQALVEEYNKLIAPQRVEVGNISATYRYDVDQNAYVLDPNSIGRKPETFQFGQETFTGTQGGGNRVNIPEIVPPGGSVQPQGGRTPGTSSGFPGHPLIDPNAERSGNLISDINRYRAGTQAETSSVQNRANKENERLDSILDSYPEAEALASNLRVVRTLTERAGRFQEGGPFRGPLAQWVQSAKQLAANFGIDIPGLDSVKDVEAIQKIIVQLGSAATRQLSNRPANFEFMTILRAFPGIENTYEGSLMVLDILEQEQGRIMKIAEEADIARRLPIAQRQSWLATQRRVYEENPITVRIPAGDWLRQYRIEGPITLTTKKIKEGEERNLPSNIYFIRDGELHQGDAQPRAR